MTISPASIFGSPALLSTTPAAQSAARRLASIEAARGAACLAVVLYLTLGSLPAAELSPVLALALGAFCHGWLGVHVFFTLSGWCIAERLALAHRRRESLPAFLADRIRRVFPTYWCVLFVALVLVVAASPLNGTPVAAAFPAGAAGWFGDLTLTHLPLAQTPHLFVSWSLFFELSCYIATALALAIFHCVGALRSAVLPLGAILCLWPLTGFQFAPLLALDRWPDFFFGALAWRLVRAPADVSAHLALRLSALYLGLLATRDLPAAPTLAAMATAGALFLSSRLSIARSHPACWSPSAQFPSLYLLHVPVLSLLVNLASRLFAKSSWAFALSCLLALASAVVTGCLLHRFVERPFEALRRRRIAPAR